MYYVYYGQGAPYSRASLWGVGPALNASNTTVPDMVFFNLKLNGLLSEYIK